MRWPYSMHSGGDWEPDGHCVEDGHALKDRLWLGGQHREGERLLKRC